MQRLILVLLLMTTLIFVAVVQADEAANTLDVAISELAWMGTTVSTYDEWVELHNNTGGAVDLTG